MTTSTLIERLSATVASYTRLFKRNDAILADVQEVNAQAPNWLRTPPTCPKHPNEPMFQSIMKTPEHEAGEWICHSCADALRFAWKEQELTTPKLLDMPPDYRTGDIFLAPIRAERQSQQEAIQQLIAARIPKRPQQNTEEIALTDLQPQRTSTANPVDNSLILWTDADDEDATERMPVVRKPKPKEPSTNHLPALEIMGYLAQGVTSKQSTGEQEKLATLL